MNKIIIISCFLFTGIFFSCAYNISSTWILPVEQELGISKIIDKEKKKNPKKQKNYLASQKILLLNTITTENIKPEDLQNINNLIKNFFIKKNYQITFESNFTELEKIKFRKQSRFFLEDFDFSFRVNKDLIQTITVQKTEQLLFIPQVLFWICEQCKEENIIFFRISLVDVNKGDLIWFAENFYKFTSFPNQETLTQKSNLLWQQIFQKIEKDF